MRVKRTPKPPAGKNPAPSSDKLSGSPKAVGLIAMGFVMRILRVGETLAVR
jgi:hypothetical protein